MEDAGRVRMASREAVEGVSPPRLEELIDARLESAVVTPGVFVIESARAAADTSPADDSAIETRAAGVQLIYEGLSLTRQLARSPPWPDVDTLDADMDVLLADVLVARGFYLLARTEAAPTAVETVRSFGYDETVAETDPATGALEIDIFELAILAGVTAVGDPPPTEAREFVTDIARSFRTNGSEPISAETIDALHAFVDEREWSAEERAARSGSSER